MGPIEAADDARELSGSRAGPVPQEKPAKQAAALHRAAAQPLPERLDPDREPPPELELGERPAVEREQAGRLQ